MRDKMRGWERETHAVSTLMGIPFHRVSMEQTLEVCERLMEDRSEPSYVVTANVDFTYLASRNPALRDFIFHSDLVICDGLPLVGQSRICGGESLPERVAGSDLGMPLLEVCARRGFSVYFLGSDDETLAELQAVLSERLPKLKIAGHCSPPFGSVESWDDAELSERIERAAPRLVLVALGCPKQEQWIARNHRSLGIPLSIGVGATLDFMVGKQQRAPKLVQRLCLEWLWRMCRHPKRLVGRYATDLGFLFKAGWGQWRASRKKGRAVEGVDPRVAERHGYRLESGVWEVGGLAACSEFCSDRGDRLVDCSSVIQFGAGELGQICEMARQVRRSGGFFAIVCPTDLVRQSIWQQNLEAQLPLFESLEASLVSRVTTGSERPSGYEGWSKSLRHGEPQGVEIT